MKPRTLAAALVLGLAACLTSAQAQVIPLPCTVLLCMAGTTSGFGTSAADPACTVPIAYWYLPDGTGLAVYDPYFDSVDSYNTRLAFLQTCSGYPDNPDVVAAIMLQHGSSPSP
jgi:hypothetical protein